MTSCPGCCSGSSTGPRSPWSATTWPAATTAAASWPSSPPPPPTRRRRRRQRFPGSWPGTPFPGSRPPRRLRARPAPPPASARRGRPSNPTLRPDPAGGGGRWSGWPPPSPGPLRSGRPSSTVALAGVGAVAASGQASMAGDGGDRRMTVTSAGLPALRPGQYYEVWLLDPDRGTVFPVGVLPRDGEGRFTLPASVVGRYQAIDVSLEADDGDPAHSKRSLLRGRYA